MVKRLTLGLSEDREYEKPRLLPDIFSKTGKYASSIAVLEDFFSSKQGKECSTNYWNRAMSRGSTLPAPNMDGAVLRHRQDIIWIMILECEQALIWRNGPPDYQSLLRDYHSRAESDSKKLKSAINILRSLDKKHAYLLRHSLQHAMQDFLSDEKIKRIKVPNMNMTHGFEWRTRGGTKNREAEFHFLSKMSLFEFDKMLDAWEREIDNMFKVWPRSWAEFGCLRFNTPIAPRNAAKMNVLQLGMLARLTSRIRDFTAGYGIVAYCTGQPIPTHGKPCWDIVAEFINCASRPDNPLTGETAQRIWQKFSKKHSVTMQMWPNPAKQEPQYQET